MYSGSAQGVVERVMNVRYYYYHYYYYYYHTYNTLPGSLLGVVRADCYSITLINCKPLTALSRGSCTPSYTQVRNGSVRRQVRSTSSLHATRVLKSSADGSYSSSTESFQYSS